MSAKNQVTGMRGVYLVAAELSRRDFIISVTSRSATGADLLVTDHRCRHTASVQVKTMSAHRHYWLLHQKDRQSASKTHVYVFVKLGDKGERDEFFAIPSKTVVKRMYRERFGKDMWYSVTYELAKKLSNWEVFGRPV